MSNRSGSSKQLNPAEITSKTWRLYKKYFRQVVFFGFVAVLFNGLIQLIDPIQAWTPLTTLFSLCFFAVIDAVFLFYVNKHEHHDLIRLPAALRDILPRWIALVSTNLLYLFVSSVGLLLVIVPGLIWGTMFSQAFNCAVFEKKGVREAFPASMNLTRGKKWAIFTAYAYVWVPYLLLLTILPGTLVSQQSQTASYNIISSIISIFGSYLIVLQSYSIWQALTATRAE